MVPFRSSPIIASSQDDTMSLRLHWVLIRIADTFRYWYLHAVEGTYRSSHPGLLSIPRPSHALSIHESVEGDPGGEASRPVWRVCVARQTARQAKLPFDGANA